VNLILRFAMAVSLAVSAVSHAMLYIHGYSHIPVIGPGFLLQASIFAAIAVLIALGGPEWLVWGAGLLAVGALIAFALSRTVGIAGFIERGWDPAPYAVISVAAEAVTVLACGGWWFSHRFRPAPGRTIDSTRP
jgi:hypothetical protein